MKVMFALGLGAMILIFGGVIWFSRVLAIGAAVGIVLLANIVYRSYLSAPACGADYVRMAAAEELSPKFSNLALSIRNVQTLSGGFFSSRDECVMEVSPMAGYDAQADQKWTRVTYATSRAKGGDASVTIHLVGPMVADSMSKSSD